MTSVDFTVRFHGYFRVGATYAHDGIGAALDHDDPLPADHLKGLMRAACRDDLNLPTGLVDEVFGSRRTPSPWAWTNATPAGDPGDAPPPRWTVTTRHRVAIDPATGSARKDHIVLGEQAFTPTATFQVIREGLLETDRVATHTLVLRAAGAAVHGLGAWRRRGLGWVGFTPDEPLGPADVQALAALRNNGARTAAGAGGPGGAR